MRLLSTYLQRNQNQPNQRNGSPKRYRRPNLPPLFYSIIGRNWQASLHRIRTHAHRQTNEIYAVEDASGDTPLHIACRLDPPVEIVRALMSTCHVKNMEGATPLHVAASHRCSAEVMKVMVGYDIDADSSTYATYDANNIDKEPLVLSLSNRLRTPMHYACLSFRGLGIDAFKILLEATIEASVKAEKKASLDQISLTLKNTSTASELKSISTGIAKEADIDLEWNDQDDDMDLDDGGGSANDTTGEKNKAASAFTMHDQFGHSPLSLLFKRYRERVKYVIRFLENKSSRSLSSSAAAASVHEELGGLWLKARMIVCCMAQMRREGDSALSGNQTDDACQKEDAIAIEAAKWAAQRHQSHSENDHEEDFEDDINVGDSTGRVFRLVHASVALAGYGCPKEMIQLAISVYPNQVREMDEEGALPLHIAAVASSYLPTNGFQSAVSPTRNISDEDSIISSISNLSEFSSNNASNPFQTVIRMLLKSYPEAARIPHGVSGRLPLILAIEAKKRTMGDGMKVLLEAYPAALEAQDLDPRLYPYIMAAIGKSREVKVRRKTRFPSFGKKEVVKRQIPIALFEAIRARPNLLELGDMN